MMQYWNERSGREKGLLAVAALLGIFALAQFGVVRPVTAARADASMKLEAASRQLDVVSAELATRSTGTGPAKSSEASSGNVRADLLQLANARGLSVSRLQTTDDDRLILQFEQAAPTLVYAWLADADDSYGIVPERVSMFAEPGGYVRASFEFVGGDT